MGSEPDRERQLVDKVHHHGIQDTEREDGDEHDDQKKTRSAPRMKPGSSLDRLGCEQIVQLKRKDSLMLCPVILKHPANIFHPRNRSEVSQQNGYPECSRHEVERERRLVEVEEM